VRIRLPGAGVFEASGEGGIAKILERRGRGWRKMGRWRRGFRRRFWMDGGGSAAGCADPRDG
jgi:hypothetical protein